MPSELVTIVVPAYAHESYIIDCLQSVYDQTYERLELIVIDDCSPDNTFRLVEALLTTKFAQRFENVVLRRNETNCGSHYSLNTGLELASGKYIALLNSDDMFSPRRVERLVEALERNNSEFAFSIVDILIDPEARDAVDGEHSSLTVLPEGMTLLGLQQLLAVARDVSVGFALLRKNIGVSTGNFMFTKRVAGKVGGFSPLKYCHDWEFILRSVLYTEPVVVSEPLYFYRIHGCNSFRAYEDVAEVETEVVLRRFFRAILLGHVSNPLCPSPENWPGYFEVFLRHVGHWPYWAREAGEVVPGWRTVDPSGEKIAHRARGFDVIPSVEAAFRRFADGAG